MSAERSVENLMLSLRREKIKVSKSSGTGNGEYFYLKYLCTLTVHIFHRELKQLHSTRC